MSFSHTIKRIYTDRTNTPATDTIIVTDDTESNSNVTVPAMTSPPTLLEVDWKATRANLRSFCITSDQAVTVFADNASPPTDTIAVGAGAVIMWSLTRDGLSKCPFSVDVTKLFVQNFNAVAAKVQIWAILHQQNP